MNNNMDTIEFNTTRTLINEFLVLHPTASARLIDTFLHIVENDGMEFLDIACKLHTWETNVYYNLNILINKLELVEYRLIFPAPGSSAFCRVAKTYHLTKKGQQLIHSFKVAA